MEAQLSQEPELLEACASGDVARVKALLYVKRVFEAKQRALLARDPKRRNQTPLHLAILNGHEGVVRTLADFAGEEALRAQDDKRWTALHHAAASGNMAICWLCVELYDKYDAFYTKHRNRCPSLEPCDPCVLHAFVDNMHRFSGKEASPKQIRKLIRALMTASGVSVDQQNSAGETALHLACFKGHLIAIQVLCDSGASLHVKAFKNSWTCLHFAARAGHMDVVKYLVQEKRVNPLIRGTQGTAADVAHQVHETAIAAYLQEYAQAYAQTNRLMVEVSCAGDRGVGASSLLLRYADNFYSDLPTNTAECFKLKGEEVDGNEVQMRLWFPTPPTKSAKPRDAVLVCFDSTSDPSFASAAACLDAMAGRDCVKVLVATKTDLVSARTLDSNVALALAERHQAAFFETSAKQNCNVQLPFRHIAQVWLQKAAETSPAQGKRATSHQRQRRGTSA